MARISLRPEDMALLAQRLDATSEELSKTSRRLDVALTDVALSDENETFSVSRFAERSSVVRAEIRRLADEIAVDAGLLAAAADGREFGAFPHWPRSLQVLAAGWHAGRPLGSAWSGVARALGTIAGSVSVGSVSVGSVSVSSQVDQPTPIMVDESLASGGGLFVSVSAAGNADVTYLGAKLGQAARAANEVPHARDDVGNDGYGDPNWDAVWGRINDDISPRRRP